MKILDKPKILCPIDIDKQCIKLFNVLNRLPDTETIESCAGHGKNVFMMFFKCTNIDVLTRLGRALNKNYSDGNFEIVLDSSDVDPVGKFWLRSKTILNDDELDESLDALCENILYWFDDEYDSYFDNKINAFKPIPKLYKYYHFWDDGKISSSRHYICRIEQIITSEEAKSLTVKVPEWDYDNNKNNYIDISLYDHWRNEVYNCDWLYAEDTDYFIKASCPQYDDNELWFVRTKDGGWFSMDIESSWQAGRLDIDGSIYLERIEDSEVEVIKNRLTSKTLELYPVACEENWRKK